MLKTQNFHVMLDKAQCSLALLFAEFSNKLLSAKAVALAAF